MFKAKSYLLGNLAAHMHDGPWRPQLASCA